MARVRAAYPALVISVDTWRAEVGAAACEAGADLLNDAWGGADPELVDVAAEYGAAIVCTHTGGVTPRTRPFRIEYDDVVAAAIDDTVRYAERALAAGVARESIVIDPAHDFGKNTFHSLELTRRLGEMVDTGWPVLVSLSNKDFVGETLDLPVGERLVGTLAATAVCALAGARIYRVHEVVETRQVVDMVWSIAGRRPAATGDPGAHMTAQIRAALVPGVPALLPSYASIDDPVAELRAACLEVVAGLGPRVRVRGVRRRAAGSLARCWRRPGRRRSPTSRPGSWWSATVRPSAPSRAPGHLDERAEVFDDDLRRALLEPLPAALTASTSGWPRRCGRTWRRSVRSASC